MSSLRNTLRAARSALAAGRWSRARSLFEQVLAAEPLHGEALRGLGEALVQSGAAGEAIARFERALVRQPLSPELLHGLGTAQLAAGRASEAVRSLSAAAALRPADSALATELGRARAQAEAPALCERGARLLAEGRTEEARVALEDARVRAPRDARVHELLGRACLKDDRLDAAVSALTRCLELDPNDAQARLHLADVFAARADAAGAESELRSALATHPALGHAWLRLAHLRRFERADDPDLESMRRHLANPALDPRDAEALELAVGKALDDLGQPAEAFAHLSRSHAWSRRRRPFDMDALSALMSRIAAQCDARFFERVAGLGSDSEAPVFVVGLPRSGSTLVEQIIASHPQGWGAGELGALPRLAADLPGLLGKDAPFPECLGHLDRATLAEVARRYLARLERDAPPGTRRVCDKMLSNLLLVGLIAALFPRARVVHCRRNLLDVGLSIWLHSFEGSGVGYAHDLTQIGRYHRECERLMAHFQRVAPVRIVELDYETLVREKEPSVRRLIESLGLDWDPRCLEPHRAERQVQTVSNWQVRQPIHTRSVARWRRYERELEPLREFYEP